MAFLIRELDLFRVSIVEGALWRHHEVILLCFLNRSVDDVISHLCEQLVAAFFLLHRCSSMGKKANTFTWTLAHKHSTINRVL